MESHDDDVWHVLLPRLLENLHDRLVIWWSVPPCVEASDLDHDLVGALYVRLLLLLNLHINELLSHVVLARWVQTLQDQDALLFEVISESLLLPAFQTDHLVLNFVESILMPFQSHLGQD